MLPIKNKWLPILMIISAMVMLAGFSPAFSWTITADFEQGTLGTKANGPSGMTGAYSQTLYSNDFAKTGSQSAKISWTQGSDGWGESGGSFTYPTEVGEGGGRISAPSSHPLRPRYWVR